MLTRKKVLAITFAMALGTLLASAAIGWKLHDQNQQHSLAAWKDTYRVPEDLAKGVDVIAVAEAGSATQSRVAYSANGEDALPFEVTEFNVIRGLKGIKDSEQILVERAGGVDPQAGVEVFIDADGGDFQSGGKYVLFLKHQETGPYYYQVNDQGRYQVVRDRLRAVDPNETVSAHLHGKTTDEAIRLIKQWLSK
jgi:hypothetical protein